MSGCLRAGLRIRASARGPADFGQDEPVGAVVDVSCSQPRESLAFERELPGIDAEIRAEHRVPAAGVVLRPQCLDGSFGQRWSSGDGFVGERRALQENVRTSRRRGSTLGEPGRSRVWSLSRRDTRCSVAMRLRRFRAASAGFRCRRQVGMPESSLPAFGPESSLRSSKRSICILRGPPRGIRTRPTSATGEWVYRSGQRRSVPFPRRGSDRRGDNAAGIPHDNQCPDPRIAQCRTELLEPVLLRCDDPHAGFPSLGKERMQRTRRHLRAEPGVMRSITSASSLVHRAV